ncbi:MAG: DUF2909 domain-containing protein [Gammaproteobacteria bacterium]|nr:DUF2909 domain-containing protein [Gammaproteobacteria bacterium]
MMLKLLVVILFIGVVLSLSSSLVFLIKDIESPKKRALYALGVRITLAALLIATVFYGLYTGQLGSNAPWDRKLTKKQVQHLQ